MAKRERASKRRKRIEDEEATKQKRRRINTEVDRLSRLPNCVLIGILTRLPLSLAITTGILSRRWRDLWTNLPSLDLTNTKLYGFFSNFDRIMTRITSPVFHRFYLELLEVDLHWVWLPHIALNSRLRQILERNVRELRISLNFKYCVRGRGKYPRVVFQAQSLVSVEFGSTIGWKLRGPIKLPNLKNLTLYFCPWNCKWLEKLTKACPTLEQLSLIYERHTCGRKTCRGYDIVEFSARSLKRLVINFEQCENRKVVMNCPMIEYLSIRASNSMTFQFKEVPIALREANIELTDSRGASSKADDELMSEFYDVISNVKFVSLRLLALDDVPITLLRKATRVTIDMSSSTRKKIMLSSLPELCPVLEVLTLNFLNLERYKSKRILPKAFDLSKLQKPLKMIELKTRLYSYDEPAKPFLKLIEYVLRESAYLEHFKVDVRGYEDNSRTEDYIGRVEDKQRSELMFCNLLYNCRLGSSACEVEFVGRFLKMSRKVGPKVVNEDGEVIPFSRQ